MPHGPGAYLGTGGVPSVCCLYPGTQGELAENLYDLAEIWSYGGEWVHAFLYKKFGYLRMSPPDSCGGCNTNCSISVAPPNPTDGQAATITVTITNTDGGAKGEAPEGMVQVSVDGTVICTQELPEDEPDSKNSQTVTCGWSANCVGGATHTIEAVYTPSTPDFAPTSCSAAVTVGNCTGCCPGAIPATVHATISNVQSSGGSTTGSANGQPCTAFAGTYALNYDPGQGLWVYSGAQITLRLEASCELTMDCLVDGVVTGDAHSGPQSVSCDPLQLVYRGMVISVGSSCCPDGGTMDVTVTT